MVVVLSLIGTLGHFLGGLAGFAEFCRFVGLGCRLQENHPSNRASAAPALSIAILRFTAPANDDADSVLATALTQDLTTALAGWRTATVVAAPDQQTLSLDTFSIGQTLNVRYLLTGEVRTVGAGMQIAARLIDASTGKQVWTEQLQFADRRASGTPPVPHLLLTKRVRSGLFQVEERRVRDQPETRDSLLESTLRGWALEDDSDVRLRGILAASEIALKVLKRDPNFVPAMWLYVGALNAEWYENPAPERDRLAREMDVWSSRAIRLDPLNFEAWRARAWALGFLGRWEEALEASHRAQALFPAAVSNLLDRAYSLNYSGRPADALPVAELARTMDPQDAGPNHFLCKILLYLGRYAEAVAACERAAALENGWFNQFYLAAAYANTGELAKATIARDALLRQQPAFTMQRYREMFRSSPPEFFALVDRHIAPALRKIDLRER